MDFSSPEAKERYVHDLFSRIAGCYDTVNKIISFNQERAWRRKAASMTGAMPGHRVLDCCCGTGALTSQLVHLVGESGRITGIDFCDKMLALAGKNCPRAVFLKGNVMDLPFPEDCFQAAIMGFALRNVADPGKAVQEMARVVEPGGRVVILELNRPRIPVFKEVFNFYFNRLVPVMGKLKSGFGDPYVYLPSSYSFLPQPGEITDMMSQAGLRDTGMEEMTGGVVALFWGTVK